MESVYGRKRLAGERETWMDRFTQLEPEGGFRAAFQHSWSMPKPVRAGSLVSLNGRFEIKPIYGRKCLSADAGVGETWMDRFTQLDPEGGFRAAVTQAWRAGAPTFDQHLALLAAFAPAETKGATEPEYVGAAVLAE